MMLSLKKLRDAPEHLKAARICDDLSPDERSLAREKVDEARLLTGNEVDPNFIHVVRGTPKNGLRIEIIKRRGGAVEPI